MSAAGFTINAVAIPPDERFLCRRHCLTSARTGRRLTLRCAFTAGGRLRC